MRLTSHKIKGSALPMVIILSFVILVFMSAMAYNFKMDLESIRVSLNYENLESLNQDNIDGIGDEIDNLPDSDYTIGIHEVDGYVFHNVLVSSEPSLYKTNSDASLYNAQPHVINFIVNHRVIKDDKVYKEEQISINKLPLSNTKISYDDNIVELNIPYIKTSGLTESQQQLMLADGKILGSREGNIGYLEKEEGKLSLVIGDTSQSINVEKLGLSSDYEVSVGWNLVDGKWQVLLALYDKDHLYISSTGLENLNSENLSKATLDLLNVNTVKNDKHLKDIVSAKWYFNEDQNDPRLVVATGEQSKKNEAKVKILDISYDEKKNVYKASNKGVIKDLGQISKDEFHLSILDPTATFAPSNILMFAGDKLYDISALSEGEKVDKVEPTILKGSTTNTPIVVKKDNENFYIITYDDNGYYQYNYTLGSNTASGERIEKFEEETIESIVVKYGVKFITTDKHLYVVDFDNKILNKLEPADSQDGHSDEGSDKVTICHKPGTSAEKTMTLPESAIKGHLGHGDYLGACRDEAVDSADDLDDHDHDDSTDSDLDTTENNNANGKGNNGHGNNADGVDSSNPGKGGGGPNGQVDPSGDVDDENSNSNENSNNKGNGNSKGNNGKSKGNGKK
ncbi:hypothetical protein FLM55_08485 [Francisella sp. Scap27]|uniref:hypothetical protein n=1 Tax=Francisella sp. Scap27 TaxID=2589986 RepID=UPI0015BA0F50|nr:hypothetical protein [Francisella sp. Scap27]QLE79768.1 hypothetical protein FLM55_08485 [Francisella sp. Scap27]